MKIESRKSKIENPRSAFTLIELLVVIMIIMLLAGLLMPALSAARNYARENKARAEIRELSKAWEAYWDAYKSWPPGPAVRDMDANAVDILSGKEGTPNTNRFQFMSFSRRAQNDGFRDPWGELYRVKLHQRDIARDTWYRTRVYMGNIHRSR